MGIMKIKNFCSSKDTVQKQKNKQLVTINEQKFDRLFTKDDIWVVNDKGIWMTNKHMDRCST